MDGICQETRHYSSGRGSDFAGHQDLISADFCLFWDTARYRCGQHNWHCLCPASGHLEPLKINLPVDELEGLIWGLAGPIVRPERGETGPSLRLI
jgi:hypothetical protein